MRATNDHTTPNPLARLLLIVALAAVFFGGSVAYYDHAAPTVHASGCDGLVIKTQSGPIIIDGNSTDLRANLDAQYDSVSGAFCNETRVWLDVYCVSRTNGCNGIQGVDYLTTFTSIVVNDSTNGSGTFNAQYANWTTADVGNWSFTVDCTQIYGHFGDNYGGSEDVLKNTYSAC